MAGFTSKEDGIRSNLRNGGNSQQCKPLLPLQQLCLSVLWGITPSLSLTAFATWFLITLLPLWRYWQMGHSLVFHSQQCLRVSVWMTHKSPLPSVPLYHIRHRNLPWLYLGHTVMLLKATSFSPNHAFPPAHLYNITLFRSPTWTVRSLYTG